MSLTAFQEQNIHHEEIREDDNRLAIKLKNKCTNAPKVIMQDKMFCYQLELKEISNPVDTAGEIIKRFSFGEPSNQQMENTFKTILLMGATGSGKTTWINAMINYVLGVEWDDPFRFKLVDEQVIGTSQAHSQTQGVTAYDLHHQNGFRVPFSLTIVDTPGFGDTQGMERDRQITLAVEKFFEHQHGIQKLDVVGFVVQSALARLTKSQKYVFHSVLSIFGKDVQNNVRFLTTFSDTRAPSILTAIKEAQLPCCKTDSTGSPCHQKFNNGAIYVSNQDDEDEMSPIEWKNGKENFKLFFDDLSDMLPTTSLEMTKVVLGKRNQLEIQLEWLQQDATAEYLAKLEQLREYKERLDKYRGKVEKNKHFETQVREIKNVKVPVSHLSALNCENCQMTCRHPYNNRDLPTNWSSTFKPDRRRLLKVIGNALLLREANCRVCPGQCKSGDHVHESQKWTSTEVTVTKTLPDVHHKYKNAKTKEDDANQMTETLKKDIDALEERINEALNCIVDLNNQLKKMALCETPMADPEYIEMMIENEKQNTTKGYEERISDLNKLLALAHLTDKIVETNNRFANQATNDKRRLDIFISILYKTSLLK